MYSGSVECSTNRINVIVLESAEEGADAAHAYSSGIIEATDAANAAAANATSAAGSATTAAANADAKAGLADSAATAANSAASTAGAAATNASTAAAAADTAREAIQDDLAAKADKYGYYPLLSAGTSDALLSEDSTVGTFARRVSDHDGACKIESLQGRTVVWNQVAPETYANTVTFDPSFKPSLNHKLLLVSEATLKEGQTSGTVTIYGRAPGGSSSVNMARLSYTANGRNSAIFTVSVDGLSGGGHDAAGYIWGYVSTTINATNLQLFDLTAAGIDVSTVAEFEAMFPDAYYPYNAGELVSVNVEGVKAIGRNLFDKTSLYSSNGYLDANGDFVSQTLWRVSDYMPIVAGTPITISGGTSDSTTKNCWYTASKAFISSFAVADSTVTPPSGAAFLRCSLKNTVLNAFQVEHGATATPYEPYEEHVREIPASTYFPDGMRGAGSVYDELTSDKAVTRIGAVDLGTLTWSMAPIHGQQDNNRYYTPVISGIVKGIAGSQVPNIVCSKYQAITVNSLIAANKGIAVNSIGNVTVYDDALKNVSTADFKNAMSGVMLYYELATPTETAIDPPLNMTYPTEQGGTESIVVPTGEQIAPPTLVTVYAYDADGIVDKSQSIVAPVEGARASANYSVGSYLVQSGTLYRVTTAIATGETITPGTNCTQTTVMAELVSLTA